MENEKKEKSLEDKIQESFFINSVLTFVPNLPHLYPKIVDGLDMISNGIDNFLGEDEKMVVITRSKGVTRAIILDRKKEFTLTNTMKLTAGNGAILNSYEKNEWKNKLLEHTAMQTLKERYENTKPLEGSEPGPDGPSEDLIGNIMKALPE